MAEPLDPLAYRVFVEHLKKFKDASPCPICQKRTWQVLGLEQAVGYFGGSPQLNAPAVPVVQVMCRVCYYMRSFAWMPILSEVPGVEDV